jgi:transcription factor IIIB subunit 2
LADFKDTPSSALSVEDFQTLMLEESADPPSFTHGKKRKAAEGDDEGEESSSAKKRSQGGRGDENEEANESDTEQDKEDEQEIHNFLSSQEFRKIAMKGMGLNYT